MITKAWTTEKVLRFTHPAKTSRNTLKDKTSHYIFLENNTGNVGIGECSPIYGLSVETEFDLKQKLSEVIYRLNHQSNIDDLNLADFPSINFALETAYIDLIHGGKRILFDTKFSMGEKSIKTNGLIWMGSIDYMGQQLEEKINQGFKCIKIKIGSHAFEDEISFLDELRKNYGNDLELRLDANGAFTQDEALEKIKILSKFGIHSIEQPIEQGNWAAMTELCKLSPIPIALDEELIGINEKNAQNLLEIIRPKYIILKPSLLGGLGKCEKWIHEAEKLKIGWWATSFLESNIGLNAISQWVSQFNTNMFQGLGTGKLFTNNIISPLHLEGENLCYNNMNSWDLKSIETI